MFSGSLLHLLITDSHDEAIEYIDMDADLFDRLKYELKLLEHDRDRAATRLDVLEAYDNVTLKRHNSPGGHSYYYMKPRGTSAYHYVGRPDATKVLRGGYIGISATDMFRVSTCFSPSMTGSATLIRYRSTGS